MMPLLQAGKHSYSQSQSQSQSQKDQDIYNSSIQANMSKPPWSRLHRIMVVIMLLISSMYMLLRYNGTTVWDVAGPRDVKDSSTKQEILENPSTPLLPNEDGSALVPLEAHIMSKCPDARDCLRDLIVPAMEKISDKVDFRLSFIGTYVTLFLTS
jgi:cytochrome c-type biogenesis protein CcmH/NrfG